MVLKFSDELRKISTQVVFWGQLRAILVPRGTGTTLDFTEFTGIRLPSWPDCPKNVLAMTYVAWNTERELPILKTHGFFMPI